MARRELRDDQWKHIQELLPGRVSDPGRTAPDNRQFVDAVLWIARTGAHWRDKIKGVGSLCATNVTIAAVMVTVLHP
jgi:transposase